MKHNTMQGLWFSILACFWFLFGAVFLLKYFISRHNLETLKELKGLELRLLEIQQLVEGRPAHAPREPKFHSTTTPL